MAVRHIQDSANFSAHIHKEKFLLNFHIFKQNIPYDSRRFIRNAKQRQDAKEEQIRAPQNKIESQIYHARCPHSPQILVFHPYEPHLAVALKDCFG